MSVYADPPFATVNIAHSSSLSFPFSPSPFAVANNNVRGRGKREGEGRKKWHEVKGKGLVYMWKMGNKYTDEVKEGGNF